jgi:predicted ArsR family transcriptional regulator
MSKQRSTTARGPGWRERLLSSTRGRIITLLRRDALTPGQVADRLQISPNAVRGHLASLARDGLVEVEGTRRAGVGKPPRVYRTTPAAEDLFPKAYEAVLSALLDVLEEGVGQERLGSLLRDVGRRAGRQAEGPEEPLDRARSLLTELGAEVEIEETREGTWFRGRACPLGALVGRRPELCGMLAALLAEVTGTPVSEHCRREDPRRPRCAFLARRSLRDDLTP